MRKELVIIFVTIISIFTFNSCNKEENHLSQKIQDSEVSHVVLIYAINHSSLSSDFIDDSHEMLTAIQSIKDEYQRLLVYCTEKDLSSCSLYEANLDADGKAEFKLLEKYPRNATSTHPDRIKEVIDKSLKLYPNARYDLFFWGHGMSWYPYFTDHSLRKAPIEKSFGGEYNSSGFTTDWVEIDDLADALPDNTFNMIWFDSCYMSSIEVLYQFRNKCRYFVGYPTEVWQKGVPYDLVLSQVLKTDLKAENIISGAQEFFNYYAIYNNPVTITVADMDKIEKVADIAKEIMHLGNVNIANNDLINYSRTKKAPFYDFRQVYKRIAEENQASVLAKELEDAIDEMVLYHNATTQDFYLNPWKFPEEISGISCHYFLDSESKEDTFYRTLAWYQRVMTQ